MTLDSTMTSNHQVLVPLWIPACFLAGFFLKLDLAEGRPIFQN